MDVDPINQAEFNRKREKVNTFQHIYRRILDFRGVFSFTVIFNERVWKTTMPRDSADKLCLHWTGILTKLKRDLKDLDFDDDVLSVQATTLHHELMIVDGKINRDSNKTYTLAVHQWTPSCLVSEACKPLVQGKLSQQLQDKQSASSHDFKKLLWNEAEEPEVDMENKEHPVETEVLRRREEIPEVQPDPSFREREVVRRFMEDYITGRRWRQDYQPSHSEYRGRAVWPCSLATELRAGEEENPMGWLPETTAEEVERLSLKTEDKEKERKKMQKNRFRGAVDIQHFLRKRWRFKEERNRKQKITLNKITY